MSHHPTDQKRRLRVFLCYAHENQDTVSTLYQRLKRDGFEPWMDQYDLLPGQTWEQEIPKAVKQADVVLACLTSHFVSKSGYGQKEIGLALDTAANHPEGSIFVIPLRMEACEMPERLSRWHWCNYFASDGHDLLLRALRLRAGQVGVDGTTPPPPPPPAHDPTRELLNRQQWDTAMAALEPQAREGDTAAALLLAEMVETAAVPLALRLHAASILGTVGDPRPGVGTLPPEMVQIEGGTFVIGEKPKFAQYDDEINDQQVTVATFALARYPITNAQYRLFIEDGGYYPDAPWWDDAAQAWLLRDDQKTEGLKDWQKRQHKQHPEWWNDERFGIVRPNHPVVGICWYEAVAFCGWLSQHRRYNPQGALYRLPTEAEWEYAARGTTRRRYPWGYAEIDGERANYNGEHGRTTPVGCFPAGATHEGLHDMAGNVWEWTGSVYKSYPYDPQDGREDTTQPQNKRFVFRGGGWNYPPIDLRASTRYSYSPDLRLNLLGFRPARHLLGVVRSVF